MDLDKLSYNAYGNLVMVILLIIATLFNLFPFSLIGLILCVLQIPLYLITRANFKEPIHAIGLNNCFVVTIIFFILLFICIKSMMSLICLPLVIIFSCLLTVLGCYVTSTLPNLKADKGKLFFGYKKHSESKYEKLIEYIKFNGIDKNLIEAEERLKEVDTQMYLLYKRKFREDKTFKEIVDEFDIDNPRIVEILDKVYYYMVGALNKPVKKSGGFIEYTINNETKLLSEWCKIYNINYQTAWEKSKKGYSIEKILKLER